MFNLKLILLLLALNFSLSMAGWCRCNGSIAGDSTEACCNKIGGSWVTYSWRHFRGACDTGNSTPEYKSCCPYTTECY
ncbi:hypothetical protein BY458DRAFT_497321 [Sporodiniella umbellata]|nr:hypothetical protein BY458DRAFT_497321 [Sporodiniella umbellata]